MVVLPEKYFVAQAAPVLTGTKLPGLRGKAVRAATQQLRNSRLCTRSRSLVIIAMAAAAMPEGESKHGFDATDFDDSDRWTAISEDEERVFDPKQARRDDAGMNLECGA